MRLAPVILLTILPCAIVSGAEPDVLYDARAAMAEGVPEVAVHKAQSFLKDEKASADDRAAAMLVLGEAFLQWGSPEKALSTIQPLLDASNWEAATLRAKILLAQGKYKEALTFYEALGERSGEAERVGRAECLQALGRTAEAIALLEPLADAGGAPLQLRLAALDIDLRRLKAARDLLRSVAPVTPEERKWKTHVEARLLLAQDQAGPALILFEEIINAPAHLPESLYFAATFGASEACVRLYGGAEGARVLEDFISQRPESAFLEMAFSRLESLYEQADRPSEVELRRWAEDPRRRRANLALFYLGKLRVYRGACEKAAHTLAAFVASAPTHLLLPQAYILQAELFEKSDRHDDAIRALDAAMRLADDPELRGNIELRAGLAHYSRGEQVLAAQLFESAAGRSAKIQQVASFDAALAWLSQRNFDRFESSYRAFAATNPPEVLRADLALEAGLLQARSHESRASETLREYLRTFPKSKRQAEARLALAEIAFDDARSGAAGPAFRRATEYLEVANDAPREPAIDAHSQYLAIFLADAQESPDDEEIVAMARKFLSEHADSEWSGEVRMKLAQVFYRRGDYAAAETQFETLAKSDPSSAYSETALFLAGQSAAQLMNPAAVERALDYFDRVVKKEGPLRLYARREQAVILQSRPAHANEALELYNLILDAQPPPDANLRQAALCGKGDNLKQLGEAYPQDLEEALSVYSQLANLPGALPQWRNQALYKKALTLEALGRRDDALDAYYDLLQKNADSAAREYFWFYKGGFHAAELFEEQQQWKGAIGIYKKMAALEGPKRAEAERRIKQIRLEHFLWD